MDSHSFWRERALQLRAIANSTADEPTRLKFLKVADVYDDLVKNAVAAKLSPKQSAGV